MMLSPLSQTSYFRSPEAIFISHATEDGDFVKKLAECLKQKGFEAWHQLEMVPGGNYIKEIEVRLDSCKAGIVVWSRSSVRKEYVQAEANRLRERECLVPVYIEDCKPPAIFGLIQGIKCRDERSLAKEEVVALCAAINKILIFGNKDRGMGQDGSVRRPSVRTNIVRALSTLHVRDLLIGAALGMLLGYSLFRWSEYPARTELEEFKKIAGSMPEEADSITPESKFPESHKSITFARGHVPRAGWPTVIVDEWDEQYKAQKRFVTMYCQYLNELKKRYYRQFVPGRSDYLKQENSKTAGEPGKGASTQTLPTDGYQFVWLKLTRCPGSEEALEALRPEPE